MMAFWVSNLKSDKEKEDFVSHLSAAQPILERLGEGIAKKIKGKEINLEPDYDSPGWSCKQADRNGYMRAMNDVKAMINLNDQREK